MKLNSATSALYYTNLNQRTSTEIKFQTLVLNYFIITNVTMETTLILLIIVITLLVMWVRAQLYTGSDTGLPPGSMGLPLIGESIEFAKKKVSTL